MSQNTYLLTEADIQHLAGLARLIISKKEYRKYLKQLSESLVYVKNLQDIDTSFISEANYITDASNVYRQDKCSSGRTLGSREALGNAKRVKNGFFVVKRIL